MENMLKVGDTVLWKGGFGRDPEKEAVITRIDKDCNGDKYGTETDSVEWSLVDDTNVVVVLDTGNWAYGDQIRPLTNQN